MKTIAVLLLSFLPVGALAQTSEDAHDQHMVQLADTALNAQYRQAMAAIALPTRNATPACIKFDGHPTYQVALGTAKRIWLTYRNAQFEIVGLKYRGGTEEDEADGNCRSSFGLKRLSRGRSLNSLAAEPHSVSGSPSYRARLHIARDYAAGAVAATRSIPAD